MANILIGFERSGIVRDAFASLGHRAYSCDIEPTRSNKHSRLATHLHCDIYQALHYQTWDLIILHPMCTALTVAGNKHYGKGKPKHHERLKAINYTLKLWADAKKLCKRVVMENPVSVIFPHLRKAGANIQYIHPWQFGHTEQKKTGLALHGVPPLIETDNVYDAMMQLPKNERERCFYMPPSEYRAELRSNTYQGIADAFAFQWGAELPIY